MKKINVEDVACSLMDQAEYESMLIDDILAEDKCHWDTSYHEDWEYEPEKYEFVIVENTYYQGKIYGESICFGVCKELSKAQAWLDEVREESRDRYKCYRSDMSLKLLCKDKNGKWDHEYETIYKIKPVKIL